MSARDPNLVLSVDGSVYRRDNPDFRHTHPWLKFKYPVFGPVHVSLKKIGHVKNPRGEDSLDLRGRHVTPLRIDRGGGSSGSGDKRVSSRVTFPTMVYWDEFFMVGKVTLLEMEKALYHSVIRKKRITELGMEDSVIKGNSSPMEFLKPNKGFKASSTGDSSSSQDAGIKSEYKKPPGTRLRAPMNPEQLHFSNDSEYVLRHKLRKNQRLNREDVDLLDAIVADFMANNSTDDNAYDEVYLNLIRNRPIPGMLLERWVRKPIEEYQASIENPRQVRRIERVVGDGTPPMLGLGAFGEFSTKDVARGERSRAKALAEDEESSSAEKGRLVLHRVDLPVADALSKYVKYPLNKRLHREAKEKEMMPGPNMHHGRDLITQYFFPTKLLPADAKALDFTHYEPLSLGGSAAARRVPFSPICPNTLPQTNDVLELQVDTQDDPAILAHDRASYQLVVGYSDSHPINLEGEFFKNNEGANILAAIGQSRLRSNLSSMRDGGAPSQGEIINSYWKQGNKQGLNQLHERLRVLVNESSRDCLCSGTSDSCSAPGWLPLSKPVFSKEETAALKEENAKVNGGQDAIDLETNDDLDDADAMFNLAAARKKRQKKPKTKWSNFKLWKQMMNLPKQVSGPFVGQRPPLLPEKTIESTSTTVVGNNKNNNRDKIDAPPSSQLALRSKSFPYPRLPLEREFGELLPGDFQSDTSKDEGIENDLVKTQDDLVKTALANRNKRLLGDDPTLNKPALEEEVETSGGIDQYGQIFNRQMRKEMGHEMAKKKACLKGNKDACEPPIDVLERNRELEAAFL